MNTEPRWSEALGLVAAEPGVADTLTSIGYTSVFDIARIPPAEFARAAGTQIKEASRIHAAAVRRANQLISYYQRIRVRHDPILNRASKLSVETVPRSFERSLGPDIDFESLFGDDRDYARPGSVESLFSPAAYLSELYGIAVRLHPNGHPLNLRVRRPDLAKLELSEHSLDAILTTLELVLGLLEEGLEGNSNPDTLLANAVYPLTLPYHHPLEKLRAVLEYRKTSLLSLWRELSDQGAQVLRSSNRVKRSKADIGLHRLIASGEIDIPAILGGSALSTTHFQPKKIAAVPCEEIVFGWLEGTDRFALYGLWKRSNDWHGGVLRKGDTTWDEPASSHALFVGNGAFESTPWSPSWDDADFRFQIEPISSTAFRLRSHGQYLGFAETDLVFTDKEASARFCLQSPPKSINNSVPLESLFDKDAWTVPPLVREACRLSPRLGQMLVEADVTN
jgi:hypothetical protein